MTPVMTAQEWADAPRETAPSEDVNEVMRIAIALGNDALPEGDAYKFTWHHVDMLRTWATHPIRSELKTFLQQLALQIEAFLPPRDRGSSIH